MFRLGDYGCLPGALPCWHKKRFETLGDAETYLRARLARPQIKSPSRLNAYHCRHCGGHHVGRRPWSDKP